ncbi:hypothetical protein DOZ80_29890 [Pseudomonas fluorescens]|uniref:Uncharacterized protein n=1 Tax=Pseudomonas fluorescens TaxID=294 RepID=A0A327MJI0_PSEFL|nr:hypothetical protein DOZ80_29890 [Pseudomonas fluorescens]
MFRERQRGRESGATRTRLLPQVFWPAAGFTFTGDHNGGSGLAREGAVSVNISIGCADLIAGKPAPTGSFSGHKSRV